MPINSTTSRVILNRSRYQNKKTKKQVNIEKIIENRLKQKHKKLNKKSKKSKTHSTIKQKNDDIMGDDFDSIPIPEKKSQINNKQTNIIPVTIPTVNVVPDTVSIVSKTPIVNTQPIVKKYTEPPSLSFMTHGQINDDKYFIVPEGYNLYFYINSGKELSLVAAIQEYYKDDKSEYINIKSEGDAVKTINLSNFPFFDSEYRKTENFISFITYLGILPTVSNYIKLNKKLTNEIGKINNIATRYPIFENIKNIDLTENIDEYKDYLEVYKYLKYLNNEDVEYKQEQQTNFYKYYKAKSFIEILNTISMQTTNTPEYEELKNKFKLCKNNTKELENIKKLVQEKIDKSMFLLKPVIKNDTDFEKMKNIFTVNNENLSIKDILELIKPGNYHFFLCRVFEKQLKQKIVTNSTIKTLYRQASVENITKLTKDKPRITIPSHKLFGTINGKILIIARFYEFIIKRYAKPNTITLIQKINEITIDGCQTLKALHDYIVTCSYLNSNCIQLLDTNEELMKDLIMHINISGRDICKLLQPKPSLQPSTKKNNKNKYISSRSTFYSSLKENDKKIKIYTHFIEPIPVTETPIAEHIKLKSDTIIELNSLQIHNINNLILIIYVFIRDILLNPRFKTYIQTILNPEELSQLNFMFDPNELSKVLLVPNQMQSNNLLEHFLINFNIQHPSYYNFTKK